MSLSETFAEAMRLSARMKADGVSVADRRVFLERALRESWPKSREEPWHYDCETCGDSGWHVKVCTPELRCGRPFKVPGQHSDDHTGQGKCGPRHDYAVPCHCARGRSHAHWWSNSSAAGEGDFTKATKAKPRTFTRFGQ
jgi:hypothetical protein